MHAALNQMTVDTRMMEELPDFVEKATVCFTATKMMGSAILNRTGSGVAISTRTEIFESATLRSGL